MPRLRPSQVALIRCLGLWRTAIDPLRPRIACFVGQGGGDAPSGAADEGPHADAKPRLHATMGLRWARKALRLHRLIEQVGGGARLVLESARTSHSWVSTVSAGLQAGTQGPSRQQGRGEQAVVSAQGSVLPHLPAGRGPEQQQARRIRSPRPAFGRYPSPR